MASPTEPAPARGITRLGDAVMRTGRSRRGRLVVVHSIARVFLPRTQWERDLWIHALSVGTLARRLAPHMKTPADPDIAYLAGLLHDLGRFVLSLEAPEELRAIDETAWEMPASSSRPRRVCGFTHAELGFLAAQRLAAAERSRADHPVPPPRPGPPLVAPQLIPLIQLVRVADWIAVMF